MKRPSSLGAAAFSMADEPMNHALTPRRSLLMILALAIAGCDSASGDGEAPAGLTEGERDRLEAAAERLDNRPPGPGAGDAAALETETGDRLAAEQAQQAAGER